MRRLFVLACTVSLVGATNAGAQPGTPSWAAPQIRAVVAAGLMATSVETFRPHDPLTRAELSVVLASLGVPDAVVGDPDRPVSMRELDARLVAAAGLRLEARTIRLAAARAGLRPPAWLGTETIARLLGFRTNHPRESEHLERQLAEPASRAEAAYSLARLLALRSDEIESLRRAVATFEIPELDPLRQEILRRALWLVGSPYVWGGSSERPQRVGSRLVPGGFDCSGLVWRVYKLEPFPLAPAVTDTLRGRTSYAMSAEVPRQARIPKAALAPADIVFFGSRGPASRPSQVGHMGIYIGGGWFVHSSSNGTTLQPLTGWYERTFAWARRPLAEVALETWAPASSARSPVGRSGPTQAAAVRYTTSRPT